MQTSGARQVVTLGRYALHAEIASGGMATVYLGRLQGPVGFSKVVAIKRMHPHIAHDPDFAVMFLDEAALAARIQHPNVVATLDVVSQHNELFIVMEYVKGPSLAALLRQAKKRIQLPLDIALGLMTGILAGLHAAHEAKSETGADLNIVHRDVSPQNVLVGLDGLPKLLDFGVAKAAVRAGVTRNDQVKGKLCYMSPEQMSGRTVDRRADIFAAGAVLWEMLAGRRLFRGDDAGALVAQILSGRVPALAEFRQDVPPAVEAALRKALMANAAQRYSTAQEFADALEDAAPKLATPRAIGTWVQKRASKLIEQRDELISQMRSSPGGAPATEAAAPESQHSGIKPGPAAAGHGPRRDDVPTSVEGRARAEASGPAELPPPRPPRARSLPDIPPSDRAPERPAPPLVPRYDEEEVTLIHSSAVEEEGAEVPAAPEGATENAAGAPSAAATAASPDSGALPTAASADSETWPSTTAAEGQASPPAVNGAAAQPESTEVLPASASGSWAALPPGQEPAVATPTTSSVSTASSVMEDVAAAAPPRHRGVLIAAAGLAATIAIVGAALGVLATSPDETAESVAETAEEPARTAMPEEPAPEETVPAETETETETETAPETTAVVETETAEPEPTAEPTSEPEAEPQPEPTAAEPAPQATKPTQPKPPSAPYVPDMP